MATNNLVNITSSGIPVYDGAGTFTAIPIDVSVANGGQGNSSLTAYAVLCGGTTTTNPVQPVASVGSFNQVLTSNGAGALPSFQDLTRNLVGYSVRFMSGGGGFADSTTYYGSLGNDAASTSDTLGSKRFLIPIDGTITAVYGGVTLGPAIGTSENVSIYINVNSSTDVTITTTSQWDSSSLTFSNAAMSQAVSAGDYITLKWVTPAWVTNPNGVTISCSVFITT